MAEPRPTAAAAEWEKLAGLERGKTCADGIAHREELGRLTALETDQPIAEAKGEVLYAASFVEWCAGETPRVNGG